jgi:proteasome lid subunit RPN8/RPN11
MDVLTMSEDASTAVVSHFLRVQPELACGLLLGWQEDEGIRVDRVLPCRNGAADRCMDFAIEPAVLANVRRSLEGKRLSIVGIYRMSRNGDGEPTVNDRQFLRHWPELVLLIASAAGGGVARGWWTAHEEAAPSELSIETAAARLKLAACPE